MATDGHGVINEIRAKRSYIAYIVGIRWFVVLIVVIGVEFFLTVRIVQPPDAMKGPILFTFFVAAFTMLIIWICAIRVFSTMADLIQREALIGSECYGALFKTVVRDLVRVRNWRSFV